MKIGVLLHPPDSVDRDRRDCGAHRACGTDRHDVIKDETVGIRYSTYEEFRTSAVVGTPDECRDEPARRELTYVATLFRDAGHPALVARLVLPLLG